MLSLILGLVLNTSFAQTQNLNQEAQVIRNRLMNSPNDCATLFSPVRAGSDVSLNTSRELRRETLVQVIDQANNKCLRILAQNIALSTHDQDREQLLALLEKISANIEFGFDPIETMCSPPESSIEGILQLAKQAKRVTSCKPNQPGEIKVIDEYKGPTGISAEYSLLQNSPKSWTASIALNVKSAEGVQGQAMFERIKRCINIASPHFKGENGKSLTIAILSPTDREKLPSNKRPPLVDIDIQPVDARSNSAAYAADISCSTIVHEVLHILGLCDEYDGKGDGYECRSVPQVDSIMKSQSRVFNRLIPRQATCECTSKDCQELVKQKNAVPLRLMSLSWELDPLDYAFRTKYCDNAMGGSLEAIDPQMKNSVVMKDSQSFEVTTLQVLHQQTAKMMKVRMTCKCPPGDLECLRIRDQAISQFPKQSPIACPIGTKEVMTSYGAPGRLAVTANGFQLPIKGDAGGSLLLPAHFERIIGGTCSDIVPSYNECAQWAYKGTENNNDCSGRPAHCAEDNWWK